RDPAAVRPVLAADTAQDRGGFGLDGPGGGAAGSRQPLRLHRQPEHRRADPGNPDRDRPGTGTRRSHGDRPGPGLRPQLAAYVVVSQAPVVGVILLWLFADGTLTTTKVHMGLVWGPALVISSGMAPLA